MAGVSGLNVPMIHGMIVSMLFTVFEQEDIEVSFERSSLGLGLGLIAKLKLRRGDVVHTVHEHLDPVRFRGDMEARVANHHVVEMVMSMHKLVNPKSDKKVDGKEEAEA